MFRVAAAAAVGQVAAHSLAHCSAGDAACYMAQAERHREPAWVAKFSEAAAGPEQLSINYGASADEMVVRWVTSSAAASDNVEVSIVLLLMLCRAAGRAVRGGACALVC